jgi:hypothetical protein
MREASRNAMSCRAIRENLNNALAAGQANAMERQTASHLQTCSGCRDYYAAQTNLYDAVDSGVRHLVETTAPPSLLPGVRERLAAEEPQPDRVWVRAFVPSTVALLIASGLLFFTHRHQQSTQQTKVTSAQSSPPKGYSSSSLEEAAQGPRRDVVALSNRPATSRYRFPRPVRWSNAAPPVIFDRQEAEGFARLASEIGQDPELDLSILRAAALPPEQRAAIPPLSMAKIEIQGLAEENR